MINVFDYEYKDVIVTCKDGRTYQGHVDWCARAIDVDEDEDVLTVGDIGLLASEIKSVVVVDSSETVKATKTA